MHFLFMFLLVWVLLGIAGLLMVCVCDYLMYRFESGKTSFWDFVNRGREELTLNEILQIAGITCLGPIGLIAAIAVIFGTITEKYGNKKIFKKKDK